MTLTVGGGPLAARPAGRTNYRLDAPKHRLLLEDYRHRLRAVVADRVVLDSTRVKALHETGHQLKPGWSTAEGDKRTQCPYKGEAAYFSVAVGGRRLEDAAWTYEAPLLDALKVSGHVCFLADGIDVTVAGDRAPSPSDER